MEKMFIFFPSLALGGCWNPYWFHAEILFNESKNLLKYFQRLPKKVMPAINHLNKKEEIAT